METKLLRLATIMKLIWISESQTGHYTNIGLIRRILVKKHSFPSSVWPSVTQFVAGNWFKLQSARVESREKERSWLLSMESEVDDLTSCTNPESSWKV